MYIFMQRNKEGEKQRKIEIWIEKQIDRYIDRDRQTDGQIDR